MTAQIFDEFEATMGNRDPAISIDKLRTNAIETSSKIVIEDQTEDLVGGFCLVRRFEIMLFLRVKLYDASIRNACLLRIEN